MEHANPSNVRQSSTTPEPQTYRWPSFGIIGQALRDYQRGRRLRIQEEEIESEERTVPDDAEGNTSVVDDETTSEAKIEADTGIDASHDDKVEEPVLAEPQQATTDKRSEPGWTFRRNHEYPWRIERTIQGDVDWRGTWVLEVKDMFTVNWTRQKIHDGRKWRWVTLPNAPHWPVPNPPSRSSNTSSH